MKSVTLGKIRTLRKKKNLKILLTVWTQKIFLIYLGYYVSIHNWVYLFKVVLVLGGLGVCLVRFSGFFKDLNFLNQNERL